ncbi:hypothetical protein KBC75_00595 [Candidatus Shapirobacteria bacterium]|nr:hypothetical protein [Candidatus Shapirobacteria bacterium]
MKKIKPLGIQIIAVIFLANLSATYYWIKTQTMASSCMTVAQVNADTSRCLYIFASKVYEKGTQASPHRGHACGSEVTSVMPSNHISNVIKYLDPNYRTDICPAVVPTPTASQSGGQATNTPVPQPTATNIPLPTATNKPVPTNTPRPSPTALQSGGQANQPTPTATVKPVATNTPLPTNTPTIGPTPTLDGIPASIAYRLSITPTPEPTIFITETPGEPTPTPTTFITTEVPVEITTPELAGVPRSNFWASLSFGAWWGVVLTIASLGTLGSTLVIGLAKLGSDTITANLAKIKFNPDKPQTVNSQGLARGEIFEKLIYVTHFGSIDENNSWVSLVSDTGQILGKLGQQKVVEGFYKVTGKKINQENNMYVAIEKIVPLEKNG